MVAASALAFKAGVAPSTLALAAPSASLASRSLPRRAAAPTMVQKLLVVVAAALIREDRVLVAQRPPGKRLAGLWEFPGGKLEQAESPEVALARELAEELAIEVDPDSLSPLGFSTLSEGKDFHLLMPLFATDQWQNEPIGAEGQELQWVTAEELDALAAKELLPRADIPLVSCVRNALQKR